MQSKQSNNHSDYSSQIEKAIRSVRQALKELDNDSAKKIEFEKTYIEPLFELLWQLQDLDVFLRALFSDEDEDGNKFEHISPLNLKLNNVLSKITTNMAR